MKFTKDEFRDLLLTIKVGNVVLVAPWIDPDREDTTDFFDFNIDLNLAKRAKKFTIFNSSNDFESIQTSVKIIRESVPNIQYKEFHNYGHFCFNDMKTEEFPELLEVLL